MKALVGAVNQEKALGDFSVIVKSSRTFLHSCIPRWVPAEQAAAPCSLDCLASDVTDRQLVARLGARVRFRLSPATPESVEVAELVLERRGRKFLSWTEIARYNRDYSSPHFH